MKTKHSCNAPPRATTIRTPALAGAVMALLAALGGCAMPPFGSDTARASHMPPPADTADTPIADANADDIATTPPPRGTANLARGDARTSRNTAAPSPRARPAGAVYATRHAVYTPVRFTELPGWSSDRFDESWAAFLQSCRVLANRAPWSSSCADAARVDARNPAAIRAFFEQHFIAYRIQPNNGRPISGLLTGYYEPVVHGSRGYGGRYVYPVYGVPRDMLYLDARRVSANARGSMTLARIDGRDVVPLPTVSTSTLRGVYALDLTDAVPDIRDKKIRMRVSERRIVPYYTRAEIERRGLQADVIAYVEDPGQLYSMQMQGSGKIVLQDSSVVRVAYADQNGHPFLPSAAKGDQRSQSRGVDDGDDGYAEALRDAWPSAPAADEPRASDMSGSSTAAPAKGLSPLLVGSTDEYGSAGAGSRAAAPRVGEQDRGVHFANDLVSTTAAQAAERNGSTPRFAKTPATGAMAAQLVSTHGLKTPRVADDAAAAPATKRPSDRIDPSYVFFRPVRDNIDGPLGALGVPLSPGRSVAVDPRTTPLGAPVYLSARTGASGDINRLMVAQDTGGAIHGAQRADLYWGSGADAQRLASTLKAPAQMWVLLPASFNISARDSGLRNRSDPLGGQHDCVMSDPDFCVDDDTR